MCKIQKKDSQCYYKIELWMILKFLTLKKKILPGAALKELPQVDKSFLLTLPRCRK